MNKRKVGKKNHIIAIICTTLSFLKKEKEK